MDPQPLLNIIDRYRVRMTVLNILWKDRPITLYCFFTGFMFIPAEDSLSLLLKAWCKFSHAYQSSAIIWSSHKV